MKIRPEILLNNNSDFFYNKILVTGSDESFINYMREHIIKFFKNKNYFIDLSETIAIAITIEPNTPNTTFQSKKYINSFSNVLLSTFDFEIDVLFLSNAISLYIE